MIYKVITMVLKYYNAIFEHIVYEIDIDFTCATLIIKVVKVFISQGIVNARGEVSFYFF